MLRVTVLLLAAAISTAQAQERMVFGPTGFSCGKWTNAREQTSERAQLRPWILGYISGLNMESDTDFLRGRDIDNHLLRHTCHLRSNPPFRDGHHIG